MLKSDPNYVFEIVSLDALSDPAPIKLSYKNVNEPANRRAVEALLKASTSRKVAVQWLAR